MCWQPRQSGKSQKRQEVIVQQHAVLHFAARTMASTDLASADDMQGQKLFLGTSLIIKSSSPLRFMMVKLTFETFEAAMLNAQEQDRWL
jgi:hypothetical protein